MRANRGRGRRAGRSQTRYSIVHGVVNNRVIKPVIIINKIRTVIFARNGIKHTYEWYVTEVINITIDI